MGEKQFNYRLAFWLVGSLAVAATAVHLVHAYQMSRHAHTLQEQANRAEEAGDHEQTAALLKRYLLFAPGDTAALLRYGETLEKLSAKPANRSLTIAAYKQVLARAPNRADVRDRLITLLLDLSSYPEAREQIEVQLQAAPGNARLQSLLARCLEEEGEYERARKTYEKTIENDPTQVECYTRLAVLLYNRFNQPEAADAVMDRLVAVNDGNFEAHLRRCEYRMSRGALDDAAKDLDVARKLAPTDAHVLVTAAELAYQLGDHEKARAAWNEGLKEHPETRNMYLGLATLEITNRRPKEAMTCLQRGLEKYPGDTDMLHLLTEAYLAQNDVDAAEEVEARVHHAGEIGLADYLRALILLHRGKGGEAIPLLEKALATLDLSNPLAGRMYVCLGLCYEYTGDHDRCRAAYGNAVARDPSLVTAHLGYATALLATGKETEALDQYRQLAKQPAPPEGLWILFGRALLQRNRALPPQRREWTELDDILRRADKSAALLVPTAILRTDVLLARNQPVEARTALEEARAQKPDQPELWVALANLAAQRGDRAGAERIVAEAKQKLGDRFALRLAAVELGIGLDDRDPKAKLLAYEKDVQGFTPEEQRRLLALLAEIHYRNGFTSEGERLTRELAARQPLDLPAAIVVLELSMLGGDEALQTRTIAELRRLEGDEGTWWRYGEARRRLVQVQRGDAKAADEVRRRVAEIGKRRPDWSKAGLIEAALCELNRDTAGALIAYTRAFEQGERQQWLVARLMDLLVAAGRAVEADEAMSKAQPQMAVPQGEFAVFAAQVALSVGQYERAVALARLAVPAESREPQKLIWLGQLLAAAKRRPEAEEAFQHAVNLRDDLLETWVALITFYANNDQVSEADAALRTMVERLAAARVPLALALCEEALGRTDLAEQHYLEARTKQPRDGLTRQRLAAFYLRLAQPAKAEPALRDLLDPTLLFPRGAAAESAAWARRQLAMLRAETGDEAGFQEAQKLLEKNGAQGVADIRAAAFVKATRDQERAEALRALVDTLRHSPLTPDEQFRLAKLYEAEGDWNSAHDHFVKLVEDVDRRNPEYLAYFIAALIGQNRHSEAGSYLRKLEKLEPESARVKKFRAAIATQP